jgi:hypothetical protein
VLHRAECFSCIPFPKCPCRSVGWGWLTPGAADCEQHFSADRQGEAWGLLLREGSEKGRLRASGQGWKLYVGLSSDELVRHQDAMRWREKILLGFCMCACAGRYMHTYRSVCAHVCMHMGCTCVHVCRCAHLSLCRHKRVNTHLYAHMYLHTHAAVCTCTGAS